MGDKAPGTSLDSGSEEDQPDVQPPLTTLHLPGGTRQALTLGELTGQLIWEQPCFLWQSGRLGSLWMCRLKQETIFSNGISRQANAKFSIWTTMSKDRHGQRSQRPWPCSPELLESHSFLGGTPGLLCPGHTKDSIRRPPLSPWSTAAAVNFLLINPTFPL